MDVRGLRHRCVCQAHRGLAHELADDHRLRARCPGAGALRPAPRSSRRPCPSFGSRFAGRIQPVVATPLVMEVLYGTTSGVDAEVDWARCDALARCAVTSL